MDRFAIQYDEHGVQLHNDYIGAIAAGIIRYWEKRKIPVAAPHLLYGMIHKDRATLIYWERVLKEEGLL